MNITNGWEHPSLLRSSFADPTQDLGVPRTAAYDGNQGGNFDYQSRKPPEGLPAGTSC